MKKKKKKKSEKALIREEFSPVHWNFPFIDKFYSIFELFLKGFIWIPRTLAWKSVQLLIVLGLFFFFLFEKESGAETTKLATEYKIKQVQMSTHFRILQVSNSLKGPLSIIDFLPALLKSGWQVGFLRLFWLLKVWYFFCHRSIKDSHWICVISASYC